jgi:hypothetical protein
MKALKALISLEVHNARCHDTYLKANAPRPNGLSCPKCGTELIDTRPQLTLLTYPPRTNVHCPSAECSFVGTRIL